MNVFTDGSALNNQNKEKRIGGIGVYFGKNDNRNVSLSLDGNVTNQIAELKACIVALKKCNTNNELNIYTDSRYVIGCMTLWITKWIQNDWKKYDGGEIKNIDLIKELYSLVKSRKKNVNFHHVKAHTKKPTDAQKFIIWEGNLMADKLATDAAKSIGS